MKKYQQIRAPAAIGPYSQEIKAGDFLFVSGQLPKKTGEFPKGGVKEQAHQVFKNIKSILADKRIGFSNVVKTTVLLDNINDFGSK